MKYEILAIVVAIIITELFGIGMLLTIAGAAFYYALFCGIWIFFLEPLLYCPKCDEHHVFGVNQCEQEHGLGR